MMAKRVWTTALTATSSAITICAFLACGVVMGMMTVAMGLMSPPPAHQDIVHQVTVELTLKPGGNGLGFICLVQSIEALLD